MARTNRNRHTLPVGWTVRDNGELYYGSTHCRDLPLESQRILPRYRRRWMRCEQKTFRKAHNREYRAHVRECLDHGRWEDINPFRRTGGWLSW